MAPDEVTDSEYLLPCGRSVDEIWERLDTPADVLDEHEAECPHCAAARESLLVVRAATRELVEEADRPPPTMFARIMSAVRAEVRRGNMLELPTPHPGSIEVSDHAVAVILRYAADTVTGVRARACAIDDHGPGTDGARTVAVSMALAVRHGDGAVEHVVPLVRERVCAAAAARTGLRLERLDIAVVDVYQEDS